MESIKHLWNRSAEVTSSPQAIDYSRITRRSVVAIAGFTIIEVLIVLAVAGLILLIVFLAVPALQRNSRNTGRKEDVGRIGGAISNFVGNNSGKLPGQANGAADCGVTLTDAGTLNQYNGSFACAAALNSAAAANTMTIQTTLPYTIPAAGTNEVELVDGASVCNTVPTQTIVASSSRSAVLLYSIETSGGWTWGCQQIQ